MKSLKLIIISFLITVTAGCGKKERTFSVPPTFVTNIEQNIIKAGTCDINNWSGFKINSGIINSSKKISKLIFWRKNPGVESVTIEYTLTDRKSDIFINGKKKFTLLKSLNYRKYSFQAKLLKGANFLEFRRDGRGVLKLKYVNFGESVRAKKRFLTAGDNAAHYFPPGKGSIEFEGKGQIKLRKVLFQKGIKKENIEKIKISSQKKYSIEFSSPGFIEISILQGGVDIVDLGFKRRSNKIHLSKEFIGKKPEVFIFLIDGCSIYHLGTYGYERETSPELDTFSRDSVMFMNAYSNATFTRSSVASIFTGFYPHRHKLRLLTNRLPSGLFMMPEFFKSFGYSTSLITEAGNVSKVFGFTQGVDYYRKVFFRWQDPRYQKRNAVKSFDKVLDFKTPRFVYVHFREPHFPIIPPAPFADMFRDKKKRPGKRRIIFDLVKLRNRGYKFTKKDIRDVIDDYDSSVRHVIYEFNKLLIKLKEKGLYDNSMIVFTSDHGEACYEHGEWGHGSNVYEETSRVPLIVKFPLSMGLKNLKVERLVQLVDIFPTFAGLFGEERFFDGESLLKSIRDPQIDDRFTVSVTYGTPPSVGIRWRNWYYIINLYDNSEELFDLSVDPLENVAPANHDISLFFRAKFFDWLNDFDNLERTSQSMDLKKLPKDEYENLKSLGYIN